MTKTVETVNIKYDYLHNTTINFGVVKALSNN